MSVIRPGEWESFARTAVTFSSVESYEIGFTPPALESQEPWRIVRVYLSQDEFRRRTSGTIWPSELRARMARPDFAEPLPLP